MRKFFKWVVIHPKRIIILFLFITAVCLLLWQMVGVNYDIKDYLPEDSLSTVSLELMNSEFEGGIPNTRVMVKNVTVPEALGYKDRLLACEGVTDVTWLDDAVNIEIPLEMQDSDTVETFYRNGAALYSVTIDEDERIEAVDAIRAVIGDDNAMSGEAVSTAVATVSTVDELNIVVICAVIFTFIVLFISTPSWLEPLVVMIGIAVAVIINSGSNLIFGEISFVTNAAGNVLQLAVSLDYSVFLMHRFEECLQENPNPEEAMVDALSKSATSILSSGLTTVIGFIALIFMRFQIGPDVGLVLAKGVAISLITVFVFMPPLIISLHKPLQKLRHRSFLPSFLGIGRTVHRIMIPMVCVFVVMIVPGYLASNANNYYYGSSHFFNKETQFGSDIEQIEAIFGKNDTYVLMVPVGSRATEQGLSDALHMIPEVKSIISYVDTVGAEIPVGYLDGDTLSKLESDNYSRMILSVEVPYEGSETFALVENIREVAGTFYPDENYLAGEGVSTCDLMNTIRQDTIKVNVIAIGAVFLILLLTMKSFSLPIILVLAIETAVWINFSIAYFTDSTVFYLAYLIISSVQLGATVDYAILLTDRYLEYRKVRTKKESVIQSVSTCTGSVLVSGSVMTVVGLLLGKVSTNQLLSQIGYFLGKGAMLSLTIVLFVLPGLLYICDGIIVRTTNLGKKKKDILSQSGMREKYESIS